MKALTDDQICDFFASLAAGYEVRLPVMLPDGTRTLGGLADGPPALCGGALPGKPTAAFFPHHEMVFAAAGDAVRFSPVREKPLLVAGFTPRDLACLRFVDRFFADGWRDDIYFRRREGTLIVGVSGYCGAGGTLLPPAGAGCDIELVRGGGEWLVVTYTGAGDAVTANVPEAASPGALERLLEACAALPAEDEEIVFRASELLRADLVPDTFWQEIADRCIACTGCNLACPTCTCFGMQDWRSISEVERSRMWDSCQFDGFMREASGHNPLGSEALRTRRRIHHKLAADPARWGEISCFLCGRCDAVCPTGIGIQAVCREMVARFGGKSRSVPGAP